MNFDPNLISMVIPIFLIVIIGFYTLGGVIKGFRKSLFKFVSFIIFLILGYVTMLWFAKFMVEGNGIKTITGFVDLSSFIGESTTFAEAIDYIATSMLGMSADQDTLEIVGALVSIIIKVVYFIVYVLVIRIVYWILEKIIWLLFFRHSRHYRKNYTQKKRSLGMVVGFTKGVIVAIMFGVAINGISGLIPNLDFSNSGSLYHTNEYRLANGDDDIPQNIIDQIEEMGLKPIFETFNIYKKSRFSQMLTNLKIKDKSMDERILDAIFVGKYEDYSMNGLTEIKNLITIAVAVADLYFAGDSFDPMEMDLMKIASVLDLVSESKLLLKLIPIGLGFAEGQGFFDDLPYGIQISKETFAEVDWASDIASISTLISDIVALGNTKLADFDYKNLNNIQVALDVIKQLTLLHKTIPILVAATIEMPEVAPYVGAIKEDLLAMDWSSEIYTFVDIYASFVELGITSFDKAFADVLDKADSDELRGFFETLFTSSFVNLAFTKALQSSLEEFFGDDPMIGSLISLISFEDITSEGWVDEFMTIVSIASDVAPGGVVPEMGIGIIKNISADKLARSELLIQALKAFIVTSYKEGSAAESLGIQDYLKVPISYEDLNSDSWDADIDGNGTLDKNGEVINFVKGLKELIDKVIPEDGELDFENLNIGEFLEKIDDDLIERLTSSNLLRILVSNALLPMLEGAGDALLIPTEVKEVVQVLALDENKEKTTIAHEIIIQEELELLFKATKSLAGSLFDENGEIAFEVENLTEMLSDPSFEEGLNYVLGSKDGTISPSLILQATISKFILDFGADGGVIVIPESVLQKEYINKNNDIIEITSVSLIKGSQIRLLTEIIIDSDINFDALDDLGLDIIAKLIPSVENGNLGNSDILNATFMKFLVENAGDFILVPKQVTTNRSPSTNEETTTLFSIKTELENLVYAVNAFGLTDFEELDFELILSDKDESTWDTILSSDILRATLSKYVNEMAAGADPLIIVPKDAPIVDPLDSRTKGAYEAENTFTKLDNTPIDVIKKEEIKALISGFNNIIMGLVDKDDDDPNNDSLEDVLNNYPTKIIENISGENFNNITNSKILYATLSKHLFALSSSITIPGYVSQDNIVKQGVIDTIGNKIVLEESEFIDLVEAFAALNLDLDGGLDISSLFEIEEEKIAKIFDSIIIRATATKLLLELADDGVLVIPGYDRVTKEMLSNETFEMIVDDKVIFKTEYVDLILTAKVLGFDDFSDDIISSLSISNILNNEATIFGIEQGEEYVGGSLILKATISYQILNLRPTLVIPNTTIKSYLDGVNEYVSTKEIIKMLDALLILGIDEFKDDAVDISISVLRDLSNADIDQILDSGILYYTLSYQIVNKVDGTGLLAVPSDAYTNEEINDTGDYLIEKAEIKALMGAFAVLNLGDDIDVDISTVLALIEIEKDINEKEIIGYKDKGLASGDYSEGKALLNSKIIWDFVSKSITDNADSLTVPYLAFDDAINTRLSKDEIVKMLVSLRSLGIETTDNLEIDLSTLVSLTRNNLENYILGSNIVYGTMSETIRTTIETPEDAFSNIYINGVDGQKLIEKLELVYLIEALDVLGLGGAGDVDISIILDLITLNKTGDEIDGYTDNGIKDGSKALLNSTIIWNFISKSITDNADSLTIPHLAYDSSVNTRLSKDEIVKMLVSLKSLGITTTDDLDLELSILVSQSRNNLEDYILGSNIVYATMSETIRTTIETPEDAFSNIYINGVDGQKLIEKLELVYLIEALDVLGLGDAGAVDIGVILDLITLNKTGNEINSYTDNGIKDGTKALLNSTIIWNFISKSITDNADSLTIPHLAYDSSVNTRLSKDEIVKMLVSLKALDIDSTDNLSIDLDLLTSMSRNNLENFILASDIVYATMSETIRTTIETPEDAYSNIYINGINGQKLIEKMELIYLIEALEVLGLGDASAVDISIILDLITINKTGDEIDSYTDAGVNDGERALLNSIIIWNFISKSITDNADSLTIPQSAYDTMITDRLSKVEIVDMLVSLKALGLDSTDNLNIELSTLTDLSRNNLGYVLASEIVYYTMSENVRTNGALEVPGDAYTNLYVNESLGHKLIKKDELIAFISALRTLGQSDADGVDITIIMDMIELLKTGDEIDGFIDNGINDGGEALLDSVIIWNFISKSITSNSSTLTIPQSAYDIMIIDRLSKDEIVNMLVAMKVLGFDDPDAIDLDGDLIRGLTDEELELILESHIMHYSISKLFIDEIGKPNLAIMGYPPIPDSEGLEYFEKDDMIYLKGLI